MSKARILVVEDEAIVSLDIQETLKGLDYEIAGAASSAEEAIALVGTTKPSLVLMDIMLAGKTDGVAAAEQIRSKFDIPIVFLTAHGDEYTLSRAKVTEPYGYVLKPFKQIELRVVIEMALHRHQMEQHRIPGDNQAKVVQAIESKTAIRQGEPPSQEQSNIIDFLTTVAPFDQVRKDALRAIAIQCRFEEFKTGDFITIEGDEDNSAFMVATGRVTLSKGSASGKDLIVELLSPKDPLGLLIGMRGAASFFSAKAQIDTKILWIPHTVVQNVLDNFPEISRELIVKVLDRLRKAHDLSRALAHDRAEVRVASILLTMINNPDSLSRRNGAPEIHLSRQELAAMTGTAPETASRVANALERDGLVDLSEPGLVRVLNKERLAELLEA